MEAGTYFGGGAADSQCQRFALGWMACDVIEKFGHKKASQHSAVRLIINMAPTYSPAWYSSTIGHEGLNFSVRYGKR